MARLMQKAMVKLIQTFPRLVSDETYIKTIYRYIFGKKLNLEQPETYNEKLQWLKLYDRNPKYADLVDKYEVKQIVKEKVGEACLIPTIGVWERFEDIDFSIFPKAFVLKCTHDSGSVVICKDIATFDKQAAEKKLTHALKRNYFFKSREYPYLNVKPRIIAESYMEDLGTEQLYDYKIFCFNGKAEYLFIATDRHLDGPTNFDYFDRDFNRLPIRQAYHPNSNYTFEKPKCYDEMLQMAEKLSEGIPQVRVDFYVVNEQLYFGELTFFHHGGFAPFIPEETDALWGAKITLPEKQI